MALITTTTLAGWRARFIALAEKHGLHPTQFGISIGGLDQVAELQHQLDEAVMATWRDVAIFTPGCKAKGYVTDEMIAKAVDLPASQVREWREIGRVPAIFFSILERAPSQRDWDKDKRDLAAAHKKLLDVRRELANVKKRLARAQEQHKEKPVAPPKLEPTAGAGVMND